MTVPPIGNEVETAKYFSQMQRLFEDIKSKVKSERFDTLSMGMSNDYELAVEHGATLIRVGTALFGIRN
jgi:hypothetical protein